MKGKVLKKGLAAITACVLASMGMLSAGFTGSAATNLVRNSTFDNGISDWSTYKESGGACTLSADNGRLALNVSAVGAVNYAVQVSYGTIPLYQNGVYRVSYEISSTVDRFVEGMIQEVGGTYQAYTWKGLNLTSNMQKIDYTFTMTGETNIMTKMVFNCGIQEQDGQLPAHTIYLDNVVVELVDDSNVKYEDIGPYEPDIMTNQIGYTPDSQKIAVFRGVTDETEFQVLDENKHAVWVSTLYGKTENSSADETDYLGDFSAVTEPGTYTIICGALDESYPFTIGENVYDALMDDTVRMLYLQRCGCAVEDATFGHPACHTGMATVYGTNETIDVSGGWHDAGDYGRYVVPAAKSVADLLFAYQTDPTMFSDSIGIPESGNGIPDVLDEVRYELEWMLKMQAASGGVYHKVSCATFPGYIMPQAETGQLIVTPVSTTATADFCASMAMAYEFYKNIDNDFASKCMEAAKKAWDFLQQNPNLIFQNPEDIVTGAYNDTSDRDERYWAAAQMYRATGEQVYADYALNNGPRTGLDWSTVGDYGNIAIVTMEGIDTDDSLYTKALNAMKTQGDIFVNVSNNSPYGVSIAKFNWGSNMTIANAGVICGLLYQATDEEKYLIAAMNNQNYLLGKNPNGVCYVTGYGTVSPQNPHHRPSMAQNQPMKGMLVGGVNSALEDDAAKAYLANTPDAKCYVDDAESYSTNEITIYWNSPLTYLLALTQGEEQGSAPIEPEKLPGDVDCDGFVKVGDVILLNRFIAEDSSAVITAQGLINADINDDSAANGDDATAILKMLAGLD